MTSLLHEYLEGSARRDPDALALAFPDRSATYGELDAMADRVAGALRAAGVERGDRVAVFAPKSVPTIAAIYGVLKAGAAYVPIDPSSPAIRAGFIARDCDVRAVVADGAHAAVLVPELEGGDVRQFLVTDVADGPSGVASERIDDLGDASAGGASLDGSDLAYILYTSGSTGEPKGVMLSHRAGMTFVEWAAASLGLRPEDRFSSHAPLHFDLSIFDLYATAKVGGALFPVPREAAAMGAGTAAFIREHGLTIWYSVPSALMLLVTQGGVDPADLGSLRHVVFAGEVFPTPYLRRFAALVPAALHNWYGPTETNVCTYHDLDEVPASDEPIPIGRACEGYECFAVTPGGRIAEAGEEGELYVGGPGVMQGYWGHPERTAEALVREVEGQSLAGPHYRTGDLVVGNEDGVYRFLGRRDHQIKTRGYRVELGEVEAAIYAHSEVREAAVVAVPDERIGHALAAFVVLEEGSALSAIGLKRHVSERLPRYMVPTDLAFRGSLPRTSTGKVDRQTLAKEALGQEMDPGTDSSDEDEGHQIPDRAEGAG